MAILSQIRRFRKRTRRRLSRVSGYRLVRTKRWGIDWLEDCQKIVRENWDGDGRQIETVFDVGANVGQTAERVVDHLHPSSCHCFEPVDQTYRTLVANTRRFPQVTCWNYGLSDTDGTCEINLYESSLFASTCDASQIISPENPAFRGTETIQLRRLDSVLGELGVEQIDILKVDTEGADLRTLRGAENALRDKRIRRIVFEFFQSDSSVGEFGTLLPIDHFLRSHDYRMIAVYTDHVHADQPTGVYNALYSSSC